MVSKRISKEVREIIAEEYIMRKRNEKIMRNIEISFLIFGISFMIFLKSIF